MDLFMEQEALKTYCRLRPSLDALWSGYHLPRTKSHLLHIRSIANRIPALTQDNYDFMVVEKCHRKLYHMDRASLNQGNDIPTPNLRCYTDGSKMGDKCGLGIVLMKGNQAEGTALSHRLGNNCTVFQAEVLAVSESCTAIRTALESDPTLPREVNILTDSQATFKALAKPTCSSKTVKECMNNLNSLAADFKVTISWIKAHAGHPGNELADEKAKEGAQSDGIPIMDRETKSQLKNTINTHYQGAWASRWNNLRQCRQTKIWFQHPSKADSKVLLKQNRETFSRLVRWITGHNFLKRHNAIIDPENPDAICRFCELEKETSSHLITDCEVLCHLRQECFLAYFLDTKTPVWRGRQLIKFLNTKLISDLEDGNNTPEPQPRAAGDPT